jgi:membrane protein
MSQATANAGDSASASGRPAPSTSVWELVKRTAKDFSQDNALRLAAAMACYIMLALAPMLVISLKVVSWIFRNNPQRAEEIVGGQVNQLIGPAGSQAVEEMIRNANRGGGGTVATIVSLLIVLFSASGVFVSLQDALNTIWEVKPKPDAGWWQWIRKRFLSMGMVLGIGILLLTSMAVTSVLGLIVKSIFGDENAGALAVAGAYVVDIVATVAVAWVLFMAVFKFLPDAKIGWKDVWVGALATAVLFKVGQIGMALYFKYGSATSAYGAFGSIVAVLLWAYYSSAIMFVGAEFTQVWARAHGREIEPEEHAVKVTEEDRAQEGIPSEQRVEARQRQQAQGGGAQPPRPLAPAAARPYGPPLPVPAGYVRADLAHADDQRKVYGAGAAGAALGAVAAGLATWYFATDKSKPTRRQAAAVRLQERLDAVEARCGRIDRLKDYLERMDVKERIDRVDREVKRAGAHLRAEETGRPLWMVRLGDLVGGRWSNV